MTTGPIVFFHHPTDAIDRERERVNIEREKRGREKNRSEIIVKKKRGGYITVVGWGRESERPTSFKDDGRPMHTRRAINTVFSPLSLSSILVPSKKKKNKPSSIFFSRLSPARFCSRHGPAFHTIFFISPHAKKNISSCPIASSSSSFPLTFFPC